MRIPLATAALGLSLALAGPAQATPVLHVRADGSTVVRDDPYLPAADLPSPGRTPDRPPTARGSATSVKQALAAALDAGDITQEQHDEWLAVLKDAQRLRGRLTGARQVQMTSQLQVLYSIAARELLDASRMPALFLQLERNSEFWRVSAYPVSGQRVSFDGSRMIFQYYPGYGLQIQPLANFGKANGLWRAGKENNLRELLDELVEIASRRGRFTTWEYWFRFGGGTPPWTSAMSQGTAIQALSRGAVLLGDPSYLSLARKGLRAFSTRAPVGVRTPGRGGGNHYLIYSFSTGLRVLNAFTQTLNGIHDYATISSHQRAFELFDKGELSLREELADYDTGAWSLYSLGGAEATTEYHGLATDFLANLCERIATAVYCDAATRFEGYETEAPRMTLLTKELEAGNHQYVRFTLSKRSTVRLTVSRNGSVVYSFTGNSPYGTRLYGWTPPRAGHYVVTLAATSFNGVQGSAAGNITVR